MARKGWGWVQSSPKKKAPKLSKTVKAQIKAKADALIEEVLRPTYIKPSPENPQFNYVADMHTKWWRNYFYFCATYKTDERGIVPSFETKFARLEYLSQDEFNLSAMRHNDQWLELHQNITLDDCFQLIQEDAWFHP